MEEHPIFGFARNYNPKLTDAEIQAKYIDNGQYLKTMEMLRKDSYSDLDPDEFLTRFHAKFEDLSKKKATSQPMSGSGASYSWDSGTPKLASPSSRTSLTGSSGPLTPEAIAGSKRAEQELALQKARQRPNFEKAADLDDYEQAQASRSNEKEYEARLNTLQSDSGNLQRAIEAADARIKEKWGDNWMEEYYARQQALEDPNYKYDKNEIIKRQQEFEKDEFINDRNKFITALEANYSSGAQILKDDKYAYARALEKYDAERQKKSETQGWGNLTLGILQRATGKLVGSVGEVMNIGENLIGDKTYGTWDKIEDFFIDFQDQTAKVAPRPTKYTRPLYTKTAKATLNGEKVEVDFQDGKPTVVRDSKGSVIDADPNQFKGLEAKNQYNGKGLFYQTGEVLADAMVQIATTKGIGGTLVKSGMNAKAAYATGVTASTMGQMAGGLYDQGLEMFDGDKRKAAQYATMTGLAIGVGSNLFGVEARLAGGPGVFDNLTITQAAKGLTPKAAAARTATNFFKQGGGEMFEETVLEKAIEASTAMILNGDAEDIDLNEMKGTALISFAVGALMGGAESDFKNSAWLVAAENPDAFKAELEKQGVKNAEKMYQKALKIKGLSEIKEVGEEDIPKLDELTDLQEKAEKAKAIGAKEQAKVFEEQAAAKEVEVFKEKKEEVVIPEDETPAETTSQGPVNDSILVDENLPAETAIQTPRQAFEQSLDRSISDLDITQEQADALKQTTSSNAKNWAKRTGKTEEEFYEKFKPTISRETSRTPDDALMQIVGPKGVERMPVANVYLGVAKDMESKGETPEKIHVVTGWEKGGDGNWKYETPDIEINPKFDSWSTEFGFPNTVMLDEIVDPESHIFKLYPDLKDIKVTTNYFEGGGSYASYYNKQEAMDAHGVDAEYIYMNAPNKDIDSAKSLLAHEIQHAIQAREGWLENAPGSDSLPANKYTRQGIEVEARNVQKRIGMTEGERKETPLSLTEDYSRDEQIFWQIEQGQTLGAFSTIDGAASAWLFDGATVETLFHEIDPTTGHFGHAVMYDILDNALPEYKAQAESDVKTIEEFLGAKDRNWTREQHEKFVAAGEKYLREGVAPTSELRPVFERLKQWLTDVFNSIKDRVDIDITPEVRAVFDRAMGGKPNTTMAAQAFEGSTDGIIFKNGFLGFKPKESFIRAVKKIWNYTFYRDGNLPDIASKLAQKRLGRIREQIKKADLSSERLRAMLKGKPDNRIRDINAALQNPNLGKQPLYYSDGTNIEEGIINELVEMRMHVDSLSSTLITEGISTGETAMTILGNLEFYLTQDLEVDFSQDWNKLNSYADAKLKRLDTKIEESEGAEQTEFKIEKLRVQAKKIQFHTANIEKAVREEEDKLRQAGKLPAKQSPRRKDIGKAYETGVYRYSDGTDIEPGIVRDLEAMKAISKEIEAGIRDLKMIGTLNMNDMPMYLTRSYQVHWDKDWFDTVQKTEAFTNAVRFFREQKDKEKDDLIALVKFYREKLNSTAPSTSMIPSVENDQGMTEAASEFFRAKLAKAELELSEIDMFDPVAEAKASLHQQADKSGSFSSSASLGSSSAGSFAKRKLIPDEIRALWGESKDPILNYMTSVYKIAHILENRRFIREVVKQGEGSFLHPFPVGDFFAKFPTSADELSDYYSTPEIVEAFKIYNQSITQSDPTNMFHRAVDALAYFSGVVKKNLTVLSISSAARNFFYNPFAMIQRGAWNPLSKNVSDAIKYFRKGTEKETLEFYRLGILGDDLISGPLAEIRRDYQKRTGEPILPGPAGKSWFPALAEKMKIITRGMETAYAFGDNFYKVIDFYRQREKLAKLYKNKPYEDLLVAEQEEIKEMAAERILSEHASYSTLPRGMRILAKQPFIAPFAPHPYEMIRNTKNMFLNQIKDMRDGGDYKENGLSVKQAEFLKTILGQAFIFGGVPVLAGIIRGAMSGMGKDDEEKLRYFLPVYHENSHIIPISNNKGKVYYLDISGVLPQGHMLGVVKNLHDSRFGPVERAENALAKFLQPFTTADPLSKSIAESFLGYQIDSPERKISIYGEEDWMKTRVWNIAGKKGPGTLNSLMRVHEAATNPRTDLILSNEIVSFGLGIRLYNVDVVNNFGFAALEVADKLQDTFGEYDRMVRSKAFGKLSPEQQEEEKRKTIERETKDYYRFANEFRRVYLAAKTFPDIDQKEVDKKMMRLGLDRYVVQGIMTGKIKEPKFGK